MVCHHTHVHERRLTTLGIGAEIAESVKSIFKAAKVPIVWEEVDVTPILKDGKTVIPDKAIKSIKANTVALKGPLATPSKFRRRVKWVPLTG